MEKKIKTTEKSKFDTFDQVNAYIQEIREINLSNIDVNSPRSYEEKWTATITWIEEGI